VEQVQLRTLSVSSFPSTFRFPYKLQVVGARGLNVLSVDGILLKQALLTLVFEPDAYSGFALLKAQAWNLRAADEAKCLRVLPGMESEQRKSKT